LIVPPRRAFIRRALALAASGYFLQGAVRAQGRPRFSAYPFPLGIASGSPTTDGFVLWTRLAPDPLRGGGLGTDAIDVRWEVAEDEKFSRIVKSGTVTALATRAHAVHVEPGGLDSARWYFYRFIAGGEASPVGRTRTAPPAGRGDETLRIALASCQQYEQGYYVAHRHLVADAPDIVAFVGDYIYESSWGREHVRKHHIAEPYHLDEYRDRYAQYKSDQDLQAAHACAPWIVTWDDHEVDNDYANDRGEDLYPDFLRRRADAYRAYFEHMPLRQHVLRPDGEMRIYDRHRWGALASLHVLDDRQYRAHQVCVKPGRGGSNVVSPSCRERLDEDRSMLGAEQERWLEAGLAASRERWTFIVQQTLMAPAGTLSDKGRMHWTDGWDGYPWARAVFTNALAKTRAPNPVVLGGDVHANYAANLHHFPERPDSPVVASEFCGTSITSQGPDAKRTEAVRQANSHILFAEGTRRGYVLLNVSRERTEAKLRVVDTVKRPEAAIATRATFVVEDGRPGVKPA
jgi:alkaline phosphatase D